MSTAAKRDVQISKSLSYLLRHGALKEKLPIDSNGYVLVSTLLRHNRLKTHQCTVQDIHRVVASNDKKRFHLKTVDGQELVCATQGHSIKAINPAEGVLSRIESRSQLPDKLVHGTNVRNCKLILESGYIKKMNRNHVHLSPGVVGSDDAVVSGMRYSSSVHIHLQLDKVLGSLMLYKSLNNVYLTPDNVPVDLIDRIVIRPSKAKDPDAVRALGELASSMSIDYTLEQ